MDIKPSVMDWRWLRTWLRRLLLAFAILHLAVQLFVGLPTLWNRTDTGRDVPVYYIAAREVRAGEPLYYPKPDFGPRVPWGRYPMHYWYLYPPHFAAALAPLASLSYLGFARVFYVLILTAFWVYAACLARLAADAVTWEGILIAGLVLMLTPGTAAALVYGNVDLVLFALFGIALTTRWKGVPLSAILIVKPYSLYFLVLASLREGRRVSLPALAVIAVATALGVAACGVGSYLDWVRYSLSAVSQGSFVPGNVSLSFIPLRVALWLGWDCPYGPLPLPVRLYLTGTAVLAPLVTAWLTRGRRPATQYACTTVAAALFSPYCLTTYLPLVLAPLAIWVNDRGGKWELLEGHEARG